VITTSKKIIQNYNRSFRIMCNLPPLIGLKRMTNKCAAITLRKRNTGISICIFTLHLFVYIVVFKILFKIIKGTLHDHLLSPSYCKCDTYEIYPHSITFSFVSLQISVNRPIMKIDAKSILSMFLCEFIRLFSSEL